MPWARCMSPGVVVSPRSRVRKTNPKSAIGTADHRDPAWRVERLSNSPQPFQLPRPLLAPGTGRQERVEVAGLGKWYRIWRVRLILIRPDDRLEQAQCPDSVGQDVTRRQEHEVPTGPAGQHNAKPWGGVQRYSGGVQLGPQWSSAALSGHSTTRSGSRSTSSVMSHR
jgi:hypothetical protein